MLATCRGLELLSELELLYEEVCKNLMQMSGVDPTCSHVMNLQ